MRIYTKYVTRIPVSAVSLFQPKFRGVPFGVDPWCCGPYIPKTLSAIELFSMYYDLFDHDTSTSWTHFVNFDLESRTGPHQTPHSNRSV